MKMEIDVPDEFIDQLIEFELLQSHKMTSQELKRLKALKDKQAHHEEDIVDLTNYLAALKVVGNWFVWQFDKKIKKK